MLLTFDDVLLRPKFSDILSRFNNQIDLTTKVTKRYSISQPIISSNMDTITEGEMACLMAKTGGLGIIHRFLSIQEQVNEVSDTNCELVAAAVGVKDDFIERAQALDEAGVDIICIDMAHGHHILMKEAITKIKKAVRDHIDIIAGNVCTEQGFISLADWGADAIKVGVGCGAMCKTRLVTGFGIPQLSAIMQCDYGRDEENYIPIIADGGIRNSGDMVKAFAAGADTVMIGSLLSGTDETPGNLIIIDGVAYKKYRGQASRDFQVEYYANTNKHTEGESTVVKYKGSAEHIITELIGGIRSGFSYGNIHSFAEKRNLTMVEVSSNTIIENQIRKGAI